jgi:hypothetical protein
MMEVWQLGGWCLLGIFSVISILSGADIRLDGCALSNFPNETYFTFFMSLKHDGDFSSIDIESKDGIVRRCNAKYTLPCYRINDDWGEVDIFTDHFDLFNSLTVDGIRVEECVSSLRRKVSPDHVLTCNCSNSTSPPGARNETALPEGLVCISGALLPLLACLSIVGLGTIAVLTVVGVYFLAKHCSGKIKRNTNSLESGTYRNLRREYSHGILLSCLKEVSLHCVADIPWKCLCRKPCNLASPFIVLYNGQCYAFFVFEEERELLNCIGENFRELKKVYHVSDVFGVKLDDLEGVLTVDDLYIRHRVSEEWKRSPAKIVVFLSDSDSPSITPNMDNTNIPIVASNEGVTEFFLSGTRERNTVLREPPVQEELGQPTQQESTSKGSPVLNGCFWLGSRSVEPHTSTKREDYQLEQNGELSTGKPRSGTCNDQIIVNPAVEDEEEVPCLSQEQPLS